MKFIQQLSVLEAKKEQIAPRSADYSDRDTKELLFMLYHPGIMRSDEMRFKEVIRRELKKRGEFITRDEYRASQKTVKEANAELISKYNSLMEEGKTVEAGKLLARIIGSDEVSEQIAYTNYSDWKQAVVLSNPAQSAKIKFRAKMEGEKTTISAVVPGEDKVYGMWEDDIDEGTVLNEGSVFKLKCKVKMISGPKDIIGKEGHIAEIRTDVAGKKKYTVDYETDSGRITSVQLSAENMRIVKDVSEASWDMGKRDFKRKELEHELRNEPNRTFDYAMYGIKIDDKLWMKGPEIVKFRSKATADKAASTLAAKGKKTEVVKI